MGSLPESSARTLSLTLGSGRLWDDLGHSQVWSLWKTLGRFCFEKDLGEHSRTLSALGNFRSLWDTLSSRRLWEDILGSGKLYEGNHCVLLKQFLMQIFLEAISEKKIYMKEI